MKLELPKDASRGAAERFAARAEAEGLLDIAYTVEDSPVGPLLLAATKRGLVELGFEGRRELDLYLERLTRKLSPRVLEAPARLDPVRRELDEYFDGRRTRFDVPLDWSLSKGFTQRILRATAKVPYGEVSTYRQMAAKAGNERAVRAAGNALGANPIPIVVPCHRILRTGGSLGGYGGGPERKEFLLRLEGFLP
ncbi:MAG TPA: methylated-DNA--[protein]-cysteine S-methyltransferase [Thermoleophilaceae bacterium]|nr:methylated-DNA--[protein]-cysteine S-methyltransferase [Thermoleophilaceae bacterium]